MRVKRSYESPDSYSRSGACGITLAKQPAKSTGATLDAPPLYF